MPLDIWGSNWHLHQMMNLFHVYVSPEPSATSCHKMTRWNKHVPLYCWNILDGLLHHFSQQRYEAYTATPSRKVIFMLCISQYFIKKDKNIVTCHCIVSVGGRVFWCSGLGLHCCTNLPEKCMYIYSVPQPFQGIISNIKCSLLCKNRTR